MFRCHHRTMPVANAPAEGQKSLRIIDLFCGAGGLTLGFVLASPRFVPVWAVDFNGPALRTYEENFGSHVTLGDLVALLADSAIRIPRAEIVIGGPPCQGFSLLNKKRSDDVRRELWRPFLTVVERAGASVFVMENVPQLLNTAEHQAIEDTAGRLGFQTVSGKLCAADYGVPQTRTRAFIIGSRFCNPRRFFPPRRTHREPDRRQMDLVDFSLQAAVKPWQTVRDAIQDLPPPEGTELRDLPPPLDLHFGRTPTSTSLARYKAIPSEGMNRFDLQNSSPALTPICWIRKKSGGTDLFGRLWWDKPAFTIRTEFFKPEKGRYLHPEQHRPITHREAARLQSFPDAFRFCGTKIEIAKQIGNAVPPLLAAAIADCVVMICARKENRAALVVENA